jgi:hypothetical protein
LKLSITREANLFKKMWREEEEIDLRRNDKNQIKRDEDRKSSKSGDRFIMNLSLTREIEGTKPLCD